GLASSRGKRFNQRGGDDEVLGGNRSMGWRQRLRVRAACQGRSVPELSQLWPIETATVLGPTAWRSTLRKNRRFARAEWVAMIRIRGRLPTASSAVSLFCRGSCATFLDLPGNACSLDSPARVLFVRFRFFRWRHSKR